MSNMLQDVVKMGTATRAMQLGRTDLAGKTGTTNEFVDAWFCGFGSGLVAVAWIGFDNPHSLGHNETGAAAALPMWISYMGKVMKGVEETPRTVPEGVVQARISPESGLRDPDGAYCRIFLSGIPACGARGRDCLAVGAPAGAPKPPEEVKSQLF